MPISLSRALDVVKALPGRSSATAEWYEKSVGDFIGWCGDVSVTKVTAEHVHRWYEELETRPVKGSHEGALAPATRNSYGRAVRAYFSHLVRLGHLEKSPAEHIRIARVPKNQLKAISESDIAEMLRISRDVERDHALIHTFRSTGARLAEVMSMRVSSLVLHKTKWLPDGDAGQVIALARKLGLEEMIRPEYRLRLRGKAHVVGKGQNGRPKERYVFLDHAAGHAMQRYLDQRPNVKFDALWLTANNTPLSTNGCYQILRKYGRLSHAKRFNPHAFRHAAAKRWLNRGMPPKVVSELLGHEEVTTTMDIYVQYTAAELSDWHEKFSF